MGKVFGTDTDIESLEKIADTAYSALKIELSKPQEQRNYEVAEKLYETLSDKLFKVVQPSNNYRRHNKGGKRVSRIERFILEAVLMYDPRAGMHTDSYVLDIPENPEDDMGGLKIYIFMDDPKKEGEGAEKGEIFRRLQHKATEVRDAGRYDLIFNALKHVRWRYNAKER